VSGRLGNLVSIFEADCEKPREKIASTKRKRINLLIDGIKLLKKTS
jgi:hypothetical protein